MAQVKTGKRRGAGRPRVETITDAQRRTFHAVREFMTEHGYSPTLKELTEILGIGMTPVHDSVKQLVRKGYLKRQPNTPRSLVIVREPEEERLARPRSIPLLGRISAGVPCLAEAEILGKAMVPAHFIRSGIYYALEVNGDSMTGAGIHDGDLVVVREQPLAEHGDIVVAMIEEEDGTLKRLYWQDEKIELRAENRKYRPIPIRPDMRFRVLGVVVSHDRQWSS